MVPQHVAIIMDGNGRWATERGLARVEGHKKGADSVRTSIEFCGKQKIRYLTLYAFSSENWKREESEVRALMGLLHSHLLSDLEEMKKNGIRLRAVGDLDRLPKETQEALFLAEKMTEDGKELTLTLALSYGGRDEIVAAAKKFAEDVSAGKFTSGDLTQAMFQEYLWTKDLPDPDLLIRTSGELRLSNFLLWQLAYTEIVVCQEYWPDFTEELFARCIEDYARRERRFGKTSEQVKLESVHTQINS
jgi:undecaprenyl diphosphate synthase